MDANFFARPRSKKPRNKKGKRGSDPAVRVVTWNMKCYDSVGIKKTRKDVTNFGRQRQEARKREQKTTDAKDVSADMVILSKIVQVIHSNLTWIDDVEECVGKMKSSWFTFVMCSQVLAIQESAPWTTEELGLLAKGLQKCLRLKILLQILAFGF